MGGIGIKTLKKKETGRGGRSEAMGGFIGENGGEPSRAEGRSPKKA